MQGAVLQNVAAQVSGIVTSVEDGQPLPGVNVTVTGTTIGTATDVDGAYTLQVPEGSESLSFSYIGYLPQEVPINGLSTINVQLAPDIEVLDEVVVTALGVERERRALAYAVSEVKAADLTQAAPMTATSALYGKAPGLQISQTASGPTGGVNITIRGVKSITGTSRPLLIVDGIPVFDRDSGYQTPDWDLSRDLGSGFNSINPNDIESISVLKGAAAAALYGAEAANGVVLITTKRGRGMGGLGVDFTSSVTFDSPAMYTDFQNEYGQGYGWQYLSGTNDGEFDLDLSGSEPVRLVGRGWGSWGPRMEGQMIRWWDNQMRPYDPQPDNFIDMFQNGHTAKTSVAVSNATSRAVYRIGYTRDDYKGIIPGTSSEGNIFTLNSNLDISTRLRADLSVNYNTSSTVNPPAKYYFAYTAPRSMKWDLLEQYYKDADGYQIKNSDYPRLHSSVARLMSDVLWRWREDNYNYDQDRLIGSLGFTYDLNGWASVNLRAGTDYYARDIEEMNRSTRPADEATTGYYGVSNWRNRVNYGELHVNVERNLTPEIGITALVGGAMRRTYEEETGVGTRDGLVVENWFSVENSKNQRNNWAWRGEEAIDGIFGSLTTSFREYLFLTLTGRNDWSSTLPVENNSYFYPSAGLSFIFSDALDLPDAITYGQLKLNYAEVGRGASRYQANKVYTYGSWNGITRNGFSTTVPPITLRPEQRKETEIGLEMAFLDNRLSFDASWYHQRNVDQILDLGVAPSSGASALTVNQGLMTNTGVEFQLNTYPVRTSSFEWNAIVNLARNQNEIVELAEGLESKVLQSFDGNLFIEARPGRPFGEIYGYDFRFTPDGERIVRSDGFYAKDDKLSLVGNITPDLIGGFINTFRYKNLSVTGVVNFQIGGDMISQTNFYGYGSGKWEDTVHNRDEATGGIPYYQAEGGGFVRLPSHTASTPNGETVRHDGYIAEGMKEVVGADGSVSYVPNDVVIPTSDYYLETYSWGSGIYPLSIYDNSYARLRELVVSYLLPQKFMRHLPAQRLQISLVGRNLFYLYKNVPNIDAESAINSTSSLQGFEYAFMPSAKSFGFRINATL